jgi:hypothetical protein
MAFLRRGGSGHQFIFNYLFCLMELTILLLLFTLIVNNNSRMDISFLTFNSAAAKVFLMAISIVM